MSGSALFTLIIGTLLSGIVPSAHAEGSGPSAPAATSQDAPAQRTNAMKIGIRIQDKVITATLMKLGSMLRVIPPVRRRI